MVKDCRAREKRNKTKMICSVCVSQRNPAGTPRGSTVCIYLTDTTAVFLSSLSAQVRRGEAGASFFCSSSLSSHSSTPKEQNEFCCSTLINSRSAAEHFHQVDEPPPTPSVTTPAFGSTTTLSGCTTDFLLLTRPPHRP